MMVKPTLAVDIDDVLADYVGECIRTYGWPVQWSDGLKNMWPNVNWDAHFQPEFHTQFLLSLRPIVGAIDVLIEVMDDYDLFYFTATKPHAGHIRETWLNRNFFPKAPIICAGSFDGKVEWLQEHPVDVLVEDVSRVLWAASNQGAFAITFDTPWNRDLRTGKRVKTWAEIGPLLKV